VVYPSRIAAMKKIKLTGRELAVMRALDFANGNTGAEIAERTHIEGEDLVDILNGMCDVGYMEPRPYVERVTEADFAERHFDLNPSYALELKEAIRRY
jgi:DNA-binding MarR family transcriptional regulator